MSAFITTSNTRLLLIPLQYLSILGWRIWSLYMRIYVYMTMTLLLAFAVRERIAPGIKHPGCLTLVPLNTSQIILTIMSIITLGHRQSSSL
jgi:hypothetical protein